jgi:hypothetical protein
MRINKNIYPDLEEIHKEFKVKPLYVSKTFESEAVANEGKFLEDAANELDLFYTKSFESIKGKCFIYLLSGGAIMFGIHGEVYGMVTKGNPCVMFKLSGTKWNVYTPTIPNSIPININEKGARNNIKITRIIGLFKEFATIKEKDIRPNGKIKEFNCRYKSDFDFPIGLLTENWYTESCRNHPFVVRGHWRWQPHGERSMQRKLIWIDPFTKDGYTKGAYKLQ